MDKDFVRNVELYSKWGSSEGPPPPNASCQQDDSASLLDYESDEHDETKTLRVLLHDRWIEQGDARFCLSFVGGTDNHMGQPGNDQEKSCTNSDTVMEYRGSVTGIAAPSISRASLWSGLWNRHTLLATTGPTRLPLLVAAETGGKHALMGELAQHAGSARLIALTDPGADELEVILDGCLHQTVKGSALDLDIPLSSGRHYVYVRATRQDAGGLRSQSWSSPVYLAG